MELRENSAERGGETKVNYYNQMVNSELDRQSLVGWRQVTLQEGRGGTGSSVVLTVVAMSVQNYKGFN